MLYKKFYAGAGKMEAAQKKLQKLQNEVDAAYADGKKLKNKVLI